MARPPSPQIHDFLVGYDHAMGALALAVRALVLDEVPDCVETVFRNHPTAVWFGLGPKMKDMFCYVATAKTHVNLGFCQGASLKDPKRALEGEGKVMRHIKLWTEHESTQPFLRSYVREAAKHLVSLRKTSRPSRKKESRRPTK